MKRGVDDISLIPQDLTKEKACWVPPVKFLLDLYKQPNASVEQVIRAGNEQNGEPDGCDHSCDAVELATTMGLKVEHDFGHSEMFINGTEVSASWWQRLENSISGGNVALVLGERLELKERRNGVAPTHYLLIVGTLKPRRGYPKLFIRDSMESESGSLGSLEGEIVAGELIVKLPSGRDRYKMIECCLFTH